MRKPVKIIAFILFILFQLIADIAVAIPIVNNRRDDVYRTKNEEAPSSVGEVNGQSKSRPYFSMWGSDL